MKVGDRVRVKRRPGWTVPHYDKNTHRDPNEAAGQPGTIVSLTPVPYVGTLYGVRTDDGRGMSLYTDELEML